MSFDKTKAFTLAEVLIVLAILGVVAALATPGVIRNSQNAKIGPTLARISTTIETAIQAACHEQEKYYFKDIVNVDGTVSDLTLKNRMDYLAKNFMKARKVGTTLPASVVNMKNEGYTINADEIYMFADKSALAVPNCTFGKGKTKNDKGEEVEVNVSKCECFALMPGYQNKKRIVLGQDFFPLMITAEGDVMTPGQSGESVESCKDEEIEAKTITGYGCADRVADNGWKADWK